MPPLCAPCPLRASSLIAPQWLYSQDIIPTLLSCLDPKHSWLVQTAAGDFIKAIITISANASQNEQQCIGPNELTRQLVSRPCVEQLIGYMLGGGNPLTVGVGIVIEVIRKNNSDYDPDIGAESNAVPSSRDPIYLGTLLRLFADNVPNFMSLIMDGPSRKQGIASTFGDKLEPLGFDRFKTCELMAELLHCSNMGLLNEVGSEQLIATRDAERHRLRNQGRLGPQREEERSTDDLSIRLPPALTDETRRLEVTNADEDGFEEVEPSKDMGDDSPHEFDKAHVGEAPAPAVSFLDRDEDDFVEEPLSSPRLSVAAGRINEQRFEEPDLVVAPLSPTKAKPADELQRPADKPPAEKAEEPAREDSGASAESGASEAVPCNAKSDAAELAPPGVPSSTHHELSPLPEHLPAPLFSPTRAKPAAEQKPGDETCTPLEPKDDAAESATASASAPTAVLEQQKESTACIEPVVGDYLKMQFVEHRVVPAILVSMSLVQTLGCPSSPLHET